MTRSFLCVSAFFVLTTAFAEAASVQVSPPSVRAGEEIRVSYTIPAGLEDAWIGIIPSSVPHGDQEVNDQHDVSYEYLDGDSTSGSLSFEAPSRPGSWDARVNDGAGREIASATFTVVAPDLSKVSLEILTPIVPPGGEVRFRFTAPDTLPDNAWVGIIPSEVPHGSEEVNDQNQEAYEYLDGRTTGTLGLEVPSRPGSWDVRLNSSDDGGDEIASATFRIDHPDATGASVQVDRGTVLPGEELLVRFTVPPGFAETAWIGIIPSSVPHGSEKVNDQNDVDYFYLEGAAQGEHTMWAPTEAGAWDVRLHDTDADGREVAHASFTVKAQLAAEDIAAKLEESGSLALYGIHFATDSARITADSATALAPVGQLLTRDPELELLIVGHTDATGDADYNLELSRRRADAVRNYLVDIFGVDSERLQSEGRGSAEPLASNETPSGRALNRRVELVRR